MKNIKLTIEYDGTYFFGWQIQKNKRTIQGEIEKALKKIFQKNIHLIASGRTDRGVHALGQVANFKTDSTLPVNKVLNALNANLADDIAIVSTEEASKNFHAQYSVKSKTYRYTLFTRVVKSAQLKNFCYHYPYPLNLKLMKREAKNLLGRKNFKSFQASDSEHKEKNAVRTIKIFSVTRKGDFIYFDIEADGFLYKMVRNIVGTLLEIGRGRFKKGSIKHILLKKNRILAGTTAPAKGLCLLKVKY